MPRRVKKETPSQVQSINIERGLHVLINFLVFFVVSFYVSMSLESYFLSLMIPFE